MRCRALAIAVLLSLLWVAAACAEPLRVAVTTSFQNSGLAAVLLPEIENDLGISVHLLVVGTGQALRLGRAGDVDAVLVHSRAAEERFVAEGYGTHRREIMFNDFVLVGPASDPARVAGASTIADAMARIAGAGAPFVSRGDDSGTHRRERQLWRIAGFDFQSEAAGWYRSAGAGMGATLNVASGLNGYALADRASWLNFANKGGLTLVFAGDPALFNQYSFLPVNPARHPHVDGLNVARLENWLASARGQDLIGRYTVNGEHPFVANARPGN